jgi:hypothetical protein
MSDITEDLDIVIDDPKAPVEAPPAGAEAKDGPKALDADEALDQLRKDLDSEKAGRLDAERRASEAAATATRARSEAQDSNLHLVTNAIELVQQRTDGLKARYADALQNQDFAAAADIQLEMSTAATDLRQLEQGKQALEEAAKAPPQAEPVADPVEHLARQMGAAGFTRSASWIRQHPEYAKDERMYRRMLAAHNLAETDGCAIDSDAYFDHVETTLGLRRAPAEPDTDPADSPLSEAAAPIQRRAAPPAAPVTRSGTINGTRPGTIRLTAQQREAAQMSGLTDEEYARELVRLEREQQTTH